MYSSFPTESRLGSGVMGRGEANRHQTRSPHSLSFLESSSKLHNSLKSKALVGKRPTLFKGTGLVGRAQLAAHPAVTEQRGSKI